MRHGPLKVLEIPHRDGCRGLVNVAAGTWGSPWAYIKGTVRRNNSGNLRGGGFDQWWRVICNDGDCPAILLVHQVRALDLIHNTYPDA